MEIKITQCTGEGQGSCKMCSDNGKWNRSWMCFLYKIEGYEGCYCSECVKKIIEEIRMSDDLISRKAVIALIDELGYINVHNHDDFKLNCRVDKIRQGVVELATAFDKEKVIEQIKVLSTGIILNTNICDDYAEGYVRAAKDIIEIIKKGGIE